VGGLLLFWHDLAWKFDQSQLLNWGELGWQHLRHQTKTEERERTEIDETLFPEKNA
jgi:hypothetical protein